MVLNIFDISLIILTIAVVASALFRYIHIPAIVGYIIVGIIVGPHMAGIISHSESTEILAEFGIIFLLFSIGLEFSLTRLMSLKKAVFVYGGMQVLLCALLTIAIGMLLGLNLSQAIVIGGIIAMSSTAIVSKLLVEQFELHTLHGGQAIGILLFQDLAVIPMLILIPGLVEASGASMLNHLGWALFNGIVAISAIFAIGRWALRPLFFAIARTRSVELFTLTALFITVGSAWLTNQLGLSLALGGFLAGMMLGETEFRHQIALDLRPFRDVLLAFFFISIGTQFDVNIIPQAWPWILLLLAALVVLKTVVIAAIGLGLKLSQGDSLRTGLILAHGGEFGFAILGLALANEILPQDYSQVVLGALLLSMIIAPIMIRYHEKIINRLLGRTSSPREDLCKEKLHEISEEMNKHVIICGYGRVGQNIARFLRKAKIEYMALDLDPTRVENARLAGEPACYANAAHYPMLEHAAIDRASAIVITFSEVHSSNNIIEQIRQHHQSLPIIVRCFDEADIENLYEIGATEVIPESVEASITLAAHILLFMKVPAESVRLWVEECRHNRYDFLRMVFPSKDTLSLDTLDNTQAGLQTVILNENADASGKMLSELPLDQYHVQVTCVRRQNERIMSPTSDLRLTQGDVLVLYGEFPQLAKAESLLIQGYVV